MPELRRLARKYRIPLASVDEVIAYRRKKDNLVTKVLEVNLPTALGISLFIFTSPSSRRTTTWR